MIYKIGTLMQAGGRQFQGTNQGGHFLDSDPTLALGAALVGMVNIIILLVLIFAYLINYRKLKSRFTLGLIIFSLLLFLQNALFIFFLLTKKGFQGIGMGLPVLSMNLIQLGALLVLLKITWE